MDIPPYDDNKIKLGDGDCRDDLLAVAEVVIKSAMGMGSLAGQGDGVGMKSVCRRSRLTLFGQAVEAGRLGLVAQVDGLVTTRDDGIGEDLAKVHRIADAQGTSL